MIARMITRRAKLAALWVIVIALGTQLSLAVAASAKAEGGGPGIVEEPIGRNVTDGGHAALSLSVTGAAPLVYQWWKNDVRVTNNTRISGATNFVLNIDPVNLNDSGNYFAIVTNGGGAITSATVSLVVSQLLFGVAPIGGTGALVTALGQVGDVYRIEVSVDFGPYLTNGYATNFTGRAQYVYRDPGVGNFRNFRVRFDHMLPVLYPPDRNDSTHVVRAYGKLNQVWRLQGALNLPSWESASSPQTNTTGWVKFREFLPNNPVRRFYRIVPP